MGSGSCRLLVHIAVLEIRGAGPLTIKFLFGPHVTHQRRMCWLPVFSVQSYLDLSSFSSLPK